MPTANYLNPTSINPSFPQQPGGALSGYLGYQDRQHFQDIIGLQKLMQAMEVMKQEEELTQGRGARTAERGANEAKNLLAQVMANQQRGSQPFLESSLAGQIGTNQSLAAKGQVDQATIGDKVMDSRLGAQGAAIEFLNRAIPRIKSATSTPLQAQVYLETLQQMPAGVRGMFPQTYGPQSVPMLEALQKQLMNNPKHMADMEKTNAEIKGRADVAAGNNAATRYTADTNYERAIDSARLKAENQGLKQNFQQYIAAFANEQVAKGIWTREQANSYVYQTMINHKLAGVGEDPQAAKRGLIDPNSAAQPRTPPPEPNPLVAPVDNTPQVMVDDDTAKKEAGNAYDPKYRYGRNKAGKLVRELKR